MLLGELRWVSQELPSDSLVFKRMLETAHVRVSGHSGVTGNALGLLCRMEQVMGVFRNDPVTSKYVTSKGNSTVPLFHVFGLTSLTPPRTAP